MFRSIMDWLELKFDLFQEWLSIKFTNYRILWYEQNKQMDSMRCEHNKETKKLNLIIEKKDKEIKILYEKNLQIKSELDNTKKKFSKYKEENQKKYLDLMNQYQDTTIKNQNLIEAKRKLTSSKGGLNSSIKFRDKKITQLEQENQDIKNLLQKVIKESKCKLTPPTIKELRNYNLYGNKKGKRK